MFCTPQCSVHLHIQGVQSTTSFKTTFMPASSGEEEVKIVWAQGADWFESALVDYDVCSNWGNWVAAAGLTGGRINHFNITKQSKVTPKLTSLQSHHSLSGRVW